MWRGLFAAPLFMGASVGFVIGLTLAFSLFETEFMRVEDVPPSVRREIVREFFREIQKRSTIKRLKNTTPEQRSAQSHKAQAARWSKASESDKLAHGALMNAASQRTYAKRRHGKTAEQLHDARLAQKRAYKQRQRAKLAHDNVVNQAGIKSPKTKRTYGQSAVTPIVLQMVDTLPPTPLQAPPAQAQASICPRCGQPSDGGLCADCVLTLAAPRHD